MKRFLTVFLILSLLLLSGCQKEIRFDDCVTGKSLAELNCALTEDELAPLLAEIGHSAFRGAAIYPVQSGEAVALKGNANAVVATIGFEGDLDVSEIPLFVLHAVSKDEVKDKALIWVDGRNYTPDELSAYLFAQTEEYLFYDLLGFGTEQTAEERIKTQIDALFTEGKTGGDGATAEEYAEWLLQAREYFLKHKEILLS